VQILGSKDFDFLNLMFFIVFLFFIVLSKLNLQEVCHCLGWANPGGLGCDENFVNAHG